MRRRQKKHLKDRRDTTNKSNYGHLAVIAGSPGMWGAGLLSSRSAYRMGVGYVTWASFESPHKEIADLPEVLTAEVNDIFLASDKITAWAVGPGLGVNQKTSELIKKMKELSLKNVILDADAVTTCVEYELFPLPPTWIVTPHSGELSRWISMSPKDIDSRRYEAVIQAVDVAKCVVLLKGFRSLVAHQVAQANEYAVIASGNAALAKAGTGDVLTGMIGALLAQGVKPFAAAATGGLYSWMCG